MRISLEVAVISHTLALGLGLKPEIADIIHIAGHLHDIGKIGVPDAALLKEGLLNREEWEQIRRHPEIGAAMLNHRPYRSKRTFEESFDEILRCSGTQFDPRVVEVLAAQKGIIENKIY